SMRSTRAGCACRRSAIMRRMKTAPSRRPTNGDTTMKITIRVIPDHTRTLGPALVSAAPAKAPISACDELVGRPQRHVIQSHVKAAARPAKMSGRSITSGFTMPFPMVVATATPKPKAATKLKKAAQATAARGVSTRVDTTVAIEFAASWKPFMKSKARATRIRRARMIIRPRQGAQAAHRVADGLHGLDEHVRERAGLRLDRAELVEPDAFRGGLDQVEHVVHARDQAMHVVAVDRRDEGLMQAFDHRVGDLVALVLDGLHALGLLRGIDLLLQHLGEQRRRLPRAV